MSRILVRQSLLLPLIVLLCRAASPAGAAAGMKVWIVGDSTRIDPTRNAAFEDDPLLFLDCLSSNYQESNLIWDAARSKQAAAVQ